MRTLFLLAFALLAGASLTPAQDKPEGLFFGNTTCPATGKPVDQRFYIEVDGQKVYTCCKACKKQAAEDPKAALAKVYPADKVVDVKNAQCPIMGKPAKEDKSVVFQGHKIHLCCPGCEKGFAKVPNKFLALAMNKELKVVGNPKCPVMPAEAVVPDHYVKYQGKLIGICCDSCVEEFGNDPAKFMKAVEAAPKKENAPKP